MRSGQAVPAKGPTCPLPCEAANLSTPITIDFHRLPTEIPSCRRAPASKNAGRTGAKMEEDFEP
jgi:hypothetical protein